MSRGHMPSASAMSRLEKCQASYRMSLDIPEPPAGPDAESGNRIHKWLELPFETNWNALTLEEQDVAERCEKQAHEVIAEFDTLNNVDLILNETRLYLTAAGDVVEGAWGGYIFSGQFDHMVKVGDGAIVIDYKTGRGEYEHAIDNAQLRALAVLAARRWDLKWVRVCIIQPLVGPPTLADYNAKALEDSYVWLRRILAACNTAEASDAVAGKWCQWCRAKARCGAFLNWTTDAVTAITVQTPEATETTIAETARGLSAENLKWHLDHLRLVEWYIDAIKAEAKARLEMGVPVDGWALRETKGRDAITNVEKVWNQLAPMGCTTEEFARVCTITKSKLKPLVKELSGAKGRALDAVLAEVIDGAVTPGKSSMKLVRVGDAAELEDGE